MSTQSVHKTDCLMSSNLVLKAWRILRGHGSSVHVGRLKELSPDGSEDNADALTSKDARKAGKITLIVSWLPPGGTATLQKQHVLLTTKPSPLGRVFPCTSGNPPSRQIHQASQGSTS